MKNKKTTTGSPDHSGKDNKADKTGTDVNSDKTKTNTEGGANSNRFDKPKREPDPDTTGIDTDSDKTKTANNEANITPGKKIKNNNTNN